MKTYKVPVVVCMEVFRVVRAEDSSDAMIKSLKPEFVEDVSNIMPKHNGKTFGFLGTIVESVVPPIAGDHDLEECLVPVSENDVVEVASH